jgi:hypothetical protein
MIIMFGFLGGMVRSAVRLLILLAMVAAAWFYREPLLRLGHSVADRWTELRRTDAVETEPVELTSPELAAVAQAKLDDVKSGLVQRAAFSSAELQSLLEYRYRGLLPAFVDSPRIVLEGDRVRLRVRVPVSRIPRVRELGDIAGLLPDTTDLEVSGQLLPGASGAIAFAVDDLSAHHIPLPRRLVPMVLEVLGREPDSSLPDDAIPIPLPAGADAAYVRADSLVLVARTAPSS